MYSELLECLNILKEECQPRLTKTGIATARKLHAWICQEQKNKQADPILFESKVIIPLMNYLLRPEISEEVASCIFSLSLGLTFKKSCQLIYSVPLWEALSVKLMSSTDATTYLTERYQKSLERFILAELFHNDFMRQHDQTELLTRQQYMTWTPFILIMLNLYCNSMKEIANVLVLLDVKQKNSREPKLQFMKQEFANKYSEIKYALTLLSGKFNISLCELSHENRFFYKQAPEYPVIRQEHSNYPRAGL